MAILLDGKALAAKMRTEIREQALSMTAKGVTPTLAVILVGDNPASRFYVNNKEKDCAECGIRSREYTLPTETTEETLLDIIAQLNADPEVDGILVQLPLPKHLSERKVIAAIAPEKDADGFHPENVGKMVIGEPGFLPCTPAGVMELLDAYQIPIAGKRCVVIGRSNIVGKPMSLLLLRRNGTVTVCHSQTADIAQVTRNADIVVCAVGKVDFLTGDMISQDAVVVDVGMNVNAQGKLVGDAVFDQVAAKASYVTPAPGGVGPMTRVMLLKNTMQAAQRRLARQ